MAIFESIKWREVLEFYKEKKATLSRFIEVAGELGLPVRFLRHVLKEYTITFAFGQGQDNTKDILNEVLLYESTVEGLRQSSERWANVTSVQTLYHEAAHASIDIYDIDRTPMFKGAVYEYKRAKLTNGKTIDDPERVAHEAAGSYVGHRAAHAWDVWVKMASWNKILESVETKKVTAANAQRVISVMVSGEGTIPEAYNRKMQERVFGYQEVGSAQIEVAIQPIPVGLRAYCDGFLLEDKIKDTFDLQWQFHDTYKRLQERLAKQGLRDTP